MVNLAREPRWGRNIETAGEDPYHLGEYAEQFVKGMQDSPTDPAHVMAGACCKVSGLCLIVLLFPCYDHSTRCSA